MMDEAPVAKLTKILQLEAEKHQDRAILGGLGRYAATWSEEAGRAYGPQAAGWVEEIAGPLRVYRDLADVGARQCLVAALLEMLEDGPVAGASSPAAESEGAPEPEPPIPPAATRSQPVQSPAGPARDHAGLDSPVTALQGIGPRQAERLEKLGVRTIRDMLYLFPRRHDDYSSLKPINRLALNDEVTIIAQVVTSTVRRTIGSQTIMTVTVSDGTGSIQATWFNQPYLTNTLKRGLQIVLSGRVGTYGGRLCFTAPQWEKLEDELLHTARLVPVYPLTEGIGAKWLRRLMKGTVDYWSKRLPDHLPASVRAEAGLMDLEPAMVHVHFPDSPEELREALHRLSFDELFVLQIGLLRQRQAWRSVPGRPVPLDEATLNDFLAALPFALTSAQQRALKQVLRDLRSEQPMNRLLQGDVGSGKTVVAAAAMALAARAGFQAALMAPTEILAEQHYRTTTRMYGQVSGSPPTVRLLTGSVQGPERDEVYAGLADGTISIVVGTHALIQEAVAFANLAFVVIDEQHRFGVEQRAALRQKGYNPHLLAMTATPIPRSLELTFWGHMDVSIIDEMPPGRQPVVTRVIKPAEREGAYAFVRSQVEKGRQAFVICPLVEESEKSEAKAAVEEHERLRTSIFPKLRLGLLHGRMSGKEKEATMACFLAGELDILVSTSVVEVGVDVPNASVMLIEGAERFGLAQLHQFRGRVGRGEHASYCLLVSETSADQGGDRLRAVAETNDGFILAQKDLELRGPGEFLGTRQSGFPGLKLGGVGDLRLVESAREAALRFFDTDPELSHPDSRLLARQVALLWQGEGEVS